MTHTGSSRLDRWFADRYDRMTAPVEEQWLGAVRAELLRDVSGDVLEIGPGTGVNRAHYPAALASLVLAEPSPAMRRHLERRYAGVGASVQVLPVGAESLDGVQDGSVDVVVSTLVLCSVGDPAAALAEVRRVLRPTGRLLLVEHVRGTGLHGLVQDAVTPLTVRLAAGCRQNRDLRAMLRATGFDDSGLRETGESIAAFVHPVLAGAAVPVGGSRRPATA